MASTFKWLCVFGGSRDGNDPKIVDNVRVLGDCLAKHDINLVYGSGKEGLMGLVAKQVFEGGCEVLGVVPEFIWEKFMEDQETYGDILVVDSMHTRKKAMFDKADGFISVPGGFGTLDETIEMITWHQLDLHKKPIGVLNISNYFDPLLKWVENAVEKGFVPQHVMDILVVSDNPEVLLKKMHEKLETLNQNS